VNNRQLFFICLCTGVFGGHYFVAGNFKKGFLYLFTAGLFGFGWLYDLVRIGFGIGVAKNTHTSYSDNRRQEYKVNFDCQPTMKDETFQIDYLLIRSTGETLKNVQVTFPMTNQYILISGKNGQDYFDTYNLTDEGLSSDNLYCKVSTCDFRFWVKPSDYNRFMNIMYHRQKIKEARREEKKKFYQVNANNEPVYDPIDDDIYKCFIAHKSGMCDAIGTWDKFYKVEEKIDEICKRNNGKYYKSSAKNAKFAIIFSPGNRLYDTVVGFREKGYKVTTFEKALEYFKLDNMWDVKAMITREKEIKKYMLENL
jgi:hypothetical protein